MKELPGSWPLITVVITTYNHEIFLRRAIDSVLCQTYPHIEIVVIDDGSEDNTRSLVKDKLPVKYFYQKNKGLSAARNAGVRRSHGAYIVFLDADDWLEKDALQLNYDVIKDKPDVAFVSGNYYLLRVEAKECLPASVTVTGNHYARLLQSNYIGMHAAVMYRQKIFCEVQFDESLRACEDYDIYLRIARRFPVVHHEGLIATYYFHKKGMSHNYRLMIESIKKVMEKQAPYIKSKEEREAYAKGKEQWKDYYALLEQKTGMLK